MPDLPEETPEWMRPVDGQREPVDLRTHVAHPARVYDFALGGKTNFAADREAAERTMSASPNMPTAARENRAFMHRAVRHLAGQGVRQFLDIGTGIPTSPNLHEVVQAVAPEARVVYVDNDPIVLGHARALLTSTAEGRTAYIDADLTDPAAILASEELGEVLDFHEPVALTLFAVLHFLPADLDQDEIVRRLLEPLPSGSYLAISHLTADFAPDRVKRGVREYNTLSSTALRYVDQPGMERFFSDLEMLEPGVVPAQRWRPDGPVTASDSDVCLYGGVARKP
nr:SAM-dependent methyltransferase [Wenjunlia vitaminophila]